MKPDAPSTATPQGGLTSPHRASASPLAAGDNWQRREHDCASYKPLPAFSRAFAYSALSNRILIRTTNAVRCDAMRCDGDTLALQNQQHRVRLLAPHCCRRAERAAADMMMAHSANRASEPRAYIDVPVGILHCTYVLVASSILVNIINV